MVGVVVSIALFCRSVSLRAWVLVVVELACFGIQNPPTELFKKKMLKFKNINMYIEAFVNVAVSLCIGVINKSSV